MQSHRNIKVLGEFLKARRAKISPEQVHIAIGSGARRTPGLRREEVAYLAGVSVTWYTWLEQGREINVSREVLDSIGNALKLNLDEKKHLFELAGHTSSIPSLPEEQRINPELKRVINSIKYPAFVVGLKTDILFCNTFASLIFPDDLLSANEKERNMTSFIFTHQAARQTIINWNEFAEYAAGVFRGYYDQQLQDPWFTAFAEELQSKSSCFKHLWEKHPIKRKTEMSLEMYYQEIDDRIRYKIITFIPINGERDTHCCVYVPVDDSVNLDKYDRLIKER